MTNRFASLYILMAAVVISAVIWFFTLTQNKQDRWRSAVYSTETGWGYNIFHGDSLFIHQDWIPVLPVQHGFQHKEQAQLAAEKVIDNIRKKGSPTIEMNDIDEILAN